MTLLTKGIVAAVTLSASLSVQATLFDRGSGMIYDSAQDLTWLQDANYAKTSGYDADGRMTWNASNTWTDSLTIVVFIVITAQIAAITSIAAPVN